MLPWKVLIVDDARAIVESLAATLERLGIEHDHIFKANNTATAMKAFSEEKPPVVFMDVDLGGEAGDHLAKQMIEEVPTTKVVLMTGMDPTDARIRKAVSAGAYDVIQKPLRLVRLKQLLELIDSEEKGLRRI